MSRRLYPLSYGFCALLVAVLAAQGAEMDGSRTEQEAVDRARTKVVVLKTTRSTGRGAATGFLAGPRLVLTAGHAVAGTRSITTWMNGVSYEAEVLSNHPGYDLAALTLRAPDLLLKPVDLAQTSANLEPGEALVILAGPAQPPAAKGDPAERVAIRASFKQRIHLRGPDGKLVPMLDMNASVERGDSGSPIIRVKDGAVVGLLSSRQLPDQAGVSHNAYAVPAEVIHPWLAAALTQAPPNRKQADEEFYLFGLPKN
jgi:S1-C subfamily serine protease